MLPVALIGCVARAVLDANATGKVLAVFRRSFYVAFEHGVVCVGPLALGRGPLNVLYAAHDAIAWTVEGVTGGMRAVGGDSALRIANRFCFDFTDAETWRAPVATMRGGPSLSSGLRLLASSARRRAADGLAPLLWMVRDGSSAETANPLLCAAMPATDALRRWLAATLAGVDVAPPALDALIGLGPGLTPSGDDYLCGALAALHYCGHPGIARRLAACVLPHAASETSVISNAYLRCAAEGEASSVLFDVLECLLDGDFAVLERRLDAIDAVGHTSGWDSLVGAIDACAELDVQRIRTGFARRRSRAPPRARSTARRPRLLPPASRPAANNPAGRRRCRRPT